MSSIRMVDDDSQDAAEVNWEDQQRINSFSRLNSRFRLIEAKLAEHRKEKDALDDLTTELELVDEDEPVLYKVGEAFVHLSHSRALKHLELEQIEVETQISTLSEAADECGREMKNLKVALYAKFGGAINLDE